MRKSKFGRPYVSRTIQKMIRKYIIEDQKKIDKRLRLISQISIDMELRGWTIKDLASRVGKRPSELRRIFEGRVDITPDLLAKIESTVYPP